MGTMMILSHKIQSLLTKSSHTSWKLTFLASIYYLKILPGIKSNYYILCWVIKVHVNQTEERIVIRKNNEQKLFRCLKLELTTQLAFIVLKIYVFYLFSSSISIAYSNYTFYILSERQSSSVCFILLSMLVHKRKL